MKTHLIDMPPQGIQRSSNAIIFYYGAEPEHLQSLSAYAEFTMVYSPNDGDGWQSVRYSVMENHKGYHVLERRGLDADEINYFEGLLEVM